MNYQKELSELASYEDVTLSSQIGRINHGSDYIPIGAVSNNQYFECCSYLYSTTNYDGIDGVEKEKNSILKGINGGSLELLDANGSIIKTFLQVNKKDGENVQL